MQPNRAFRRRRRRLSAADLGRTARIARLRFFALGEFVQFVEGFASVPGDVFENADRRVDLAVECGEQVVPGDLNLDQRPDEIVKFVGVALFVLVALVFVFVGHRTQFLPV